MAVLLGGAPAAAQEPQTIPAGTTSQVSLPRSNTVATCTPPGMFQPSPTEWTVNPQSVQISGTTEQKPPEGHVLSVTVPADHSPFQPITISWSGNSSCESYNGSITLRVSAAGSPQPPPPPGIPRPPVAPPPPVADRSGKIPCGTMTIAGRRNRVFARGITCEQARDILSGRATGWRCYGSRTRGRTRYRYLCRRVTTPRRSSTNWTFSIPLGADRCDPVQYRGRFWDVYKRGVLCRYARSTALRALRGDSPIVYEFTNPSQGFFGRWGCRQYGTAFRRYGLCNKVIENRLVAWVPSARRR